MLPVLTVLVLALMGTYIGENHQVSCLTDVELTMVPNSYDDQYMSCSATMENKLMDPTTDGFQQKYDFVWKNATNTWNNIKGSLQLPYDFKEEYGIAVVAYTACSKLYLNFGPAVREGGKSSADYEKYFNFKSFHFLLTRASQVLKASQAGCYNVYRGIKNIRFTVPDRNTLVRFGQFTSSSLSRQAAKKFGDDTFFTIRTCLGNDIIKFSYFPEQQEILIPPYETFKVVDVKNVGGKTEITLQNDGRSSNFNCGSKSGGRNSRSVDNQRDSSNRLMLRGYSGMDTRSLAALEQMDADYLAAKCNGPSSLTPGVPMSFLLWGFLLFSGALHTTGSL
ncbi:NAD(P)(+)--arginine ADP-ribosyltransferase 2-like [Anolis sagrei]|uniref:NAD(P)(+)--arginine ADP-ribosyltransferase 2-like n=1 Tax=Anolis sagrei TaxID=38937 RepID=UPI003521F8D0